MSSSTYDPIVYIIKYKGRFTERKPWAWRGSLASQLFGTYFLYILLYYINMLIENFQNFKRWGLIKLEYSCNAKWVTEWGETSRMEENACKLHIWQGINSWNMNRNTTNSMTNTHKNSLIKMDSKWVQLWWKTIWKFISKSKIE